MPTTTFLSKKDNAKSTLAAAIDTVIDDFAVASGEGVNFPSSNVELTIWDQTNYPDPTDDPNMEQVLVGVRTGDNLTTVTRGYGGTTPSNHAAGSAIRLLITKEWFDEYDTAIHSLEGLTYPTASFAAGDLLYASSATQLARLAISVTAGRVLGWTAGLPAWVDPLGVTSPYVTGDILYASSTTVFSRLGKGTANQVLKMASDASLPQWRDEYGASSIVVGETPSGTINGSNAVFTTAATFASGALEVFKNGVMMKGGGADYTVNGSNNGFTMTTAPATGTVLLVNYYKTVDFANVGTNSLKEDETPAGTINGSNVNFTTAFGYIAGSLQVFLNGQKQTRTNDFTETTPGSGTFAFVTAPATGATVRVSYMVNQNASGNADTIDGFHASATATASTILPLDGSGLFPQSVLATTTLGYAEQTGGDQAGIGAETDITGVLVAVTVPAGGRRVRITFECTFLMSGAAQTYFRIKESTTTKQIRYANASGGSVSTTHRQQYIFTPTAGAHTYKVSAQASAGTTTIHTAATEEAYIHVELI